MRLVLTVSCPDRPGIVAAVARWILEMGGNIVEADQHSDTEAGLFLQRVEFDADITADDARASFRPTGEQFAMGWQIHAVGIAARVALLASREGHCLYDLLSRVETGDLPAEPVALVSNHTVLSGAAERYGVPFHHLPVDDAVRDAQEVELRTLLHEIAPDLVILARYMRILSPDYVGQFGARTINIHHSFLPAFAGARPYAQAYERGVKIIGATAHYITDDLDEGPIIAQGVTDVSHRDDVEDLKRRGRDLETVVLARAVRLHLEHRVIAYANRTVVFD